MTVSDVQAISPQNKALVETGAEMLAKSVEVGRDFCKTMMTVCSTAIPIHVTLVGLATGKEFNFSLEQGALALLGPALYLVALAIFAYGYFPGRGSFSLEDVDSIATVRNAAIDRRYGSALIGVIVFVLAVVATLWATMHFFSLPDPTPVETGATGMP